MNDYKELIKIIDGVLEKDSTPTLAMLAVAADAIEQLIDEQDTLKIVIEQLAKEREAAIATIPHKCWSCGKGYHTETGFECEEAWYKSNNPDCLSWEWRGVTDDN